MPKLLNKAPATPIPDSRTLANNVPHVTQALLGFIEERGLAPERLCRGLGFTYQDLMSRELLLSYDQVRTVILRAQLLLGDEPALGLAVGARETLVSWGVAGLAMLTCETFGEAMLFGIEHQNEGGAMVDHRFEVHGRRMFLDAVPRVFDLLVEPFLVEESFAGAVAVARSVVSKEFSPVRVDLGFPAPANSAVYRRFFRCPVRFDAGCHRMTFDAHWLDARVPGYDRITCGLLRQQLNTLLKRPIGKSDLVESMSNRLRFDIDARPRQKDLAQMINVSDRTLRRRLNQQNVNYTQLRDGTRFERACDLLSHTQMTIAQIADAVGYSDARAFRRAFKRWSGQLPGEFRSDR
ncbi:helix-turn-helix domain-containing protein [Variovorax guangxiensis]|uniref:Helix-turn-helix domain-containing protein n=1 Tax=Variovorax guangxiensis TaxID=1775474 RepID=A0A3S0Z8S9_9BURK|nr:AraC family transcriptional regulator [Variovorax guangxiensis]RUR71257.1 helix-turn-helix domain-containing protein [Variovorax guangxiensis]